MSATCHVQVSNISVTSCRGAPFSLVMSRFDDTVSLYRNQVYTFARYLVRDVGAAEDVTQEAFIRLWRHPRMLRSNKLLPWLLKVTRNLCLDSLRSQRARRRLEAVHLDAVPETADRSPGPEVLACSSEYQRSIVAAIDELREPARSIVVLREVQGFSYQEIADALALNLSNVRVSLHRARRQMRERLKEVVTHAAAS